MAEILYGRQIVLELVRAGRRKIESICLQEGINGPQVDTLYQSPVLAKKIQKMTRSSLEHKLPAGVHHQGFAAVVSPFPYDTEEILRPGETSLYLALDSIQDPQNVGAILRSAEAMTVDAVIIPKDRACLVTPAVVRASAGASEHLRVVLITNLSRTLRELGEGGSWVVGAASEGGTPLEKMKWGPQTTLVIGNEGEGLRDGVAKSCHELVSIPLQGKTANLNASVAAGVLIYAASRAVCRDRAS